MGGCTIMKARVRIRQSTDLDGDFLDEVMMVPDDTDLESEIKLPGEIPARVEDIDSGTDPVTMVVYVDRHEYTKVRDALHPAA